MGGRGVGTNPEELLVCAVSSCNTATLFAALRRAQLPIESLTVRASGTVTGFPAATRFTWIVVTPTVIGGDVACQPGYEAVASLVARSLPHRPHARPRGRLRGRLSARARRPFAGTDPAASGLPGCRRRVRPVPERHVAEVVTDPLHQRKFVRRDGPALTRAEHQPITAARIDGLARDRNRTPCSHSLPLARRARYGQRRSGPRVLAHSRTRRLGRGKTIPCVRRKRSTSRVV